MLSFQMIVDQYIKPNGLYISIALACILFSVVGYYAYEHYFVSKSDTSKYSDVANANRRYRIVTIYFFNAGWCPHCKSALPEWNAFVSQYDKKVINGYEIKCVNVDCTEETAAVTTMINKYGIESYPTVKMEKDGKIIDFDSKITNTALEKFINTMIH